MFKKSPIDQFKIISTVLSNWVYIFFVHSVLLCAYRFGVVETPRITGPFMNEMQIKPYISKK